MPLPAFNYGSDDSGLACGFLIGDGARTETIDAADALARLRQPASVPAPRQFVWLHANLSKAASERWLRSHAGLGDGFYELLHQGSRSTRIEILDDALVAVRRPVPPGIIVPEIY